MYLIIGLGNPEPEYSKTRHNMGFDVINKISIKCGIDISKQNYEAKYGMGYIDMQKVILIKPQTYMNLSGISAKKYIDFYKIPLENIIVIYDDMDTQLGEIRIRAKGGAGSHNGMKSMIKELNSENFSRIRVGIGKPKEEYEKINYVIGKVQEEEYKQLEEGENKAVEAAIYYIKNGIDNTMNKYNVKNNNI